MSQEQLEECTVNQDGAAAYLAYITGNNGAPITIESVQTITRYVKDVDTKVVVSTGLTVAGVVFDTLQTNAALWPYATGFNFLDNLPASSFPDAHEYLVQYLIVPQAGEQF